MFVPITILMPFLCFYTGASLMEPTQMEAKLPVPKELNGKQDEGVAEKSAVAAGVTRRRYLGGAEGGYHSVPRVALRSEKGFNKHCCIGRQCGFRIRRCELGSCYGRQVLAVPSLLLRRRGSISHLQCPTLLLRRLLRTSPPVGRRRSR